ncbi:MAG: sigma-70 family RNA polymerase sigma factor [Alphaproteobacteria bacterium]|nr:sigma-70 family RNA polymerase sigma factor [Alphaproteobacteria bacterium]
MAALPHMHPPESDDALVHRARHGDRAAYGELVLRYQDPIHGLCARWLGNAESASEIAQEVFLAAWSALPRFRGEARFDTWLRRIAVNRCRNHRLHRQRRAHDRHVSLEGERDDGPPLQLVHGGRGTDGRAERAAARDVLQRALDQVDPDHRAVLVLRDLQDLDYEEIATLLEVPRGTVKSRLHRARLALAEALDALVGPQDVLG